MGHPALGGRRGRQVAPPLQQLLVLGVVAQPAQQRLAGVAPHADVGQAHRQGHQGREVVRVELQAPARGGKAGVRRVSVGGATPPALLLIIGSTSRDQRGYF